MNKFVIDIDSNDFERSRKSACVYCGDTTSLTRDHVVAVSWTGYKRSYSVGDCVPACKECNSLLGNKPLFSISTRANFIANELSKKYKKILNHPNWDNDEISFMSKDFQNNLKHMKNAKKFIESRIKHAVLTSLDESDLIKVKQVTHDDNCIYRMLIFLIRGESYKDASIKFNTDPKSIKKILTSKKNFSVLSLFKWENKIPFDESILKVIKAVQDRKKLTSKISKN